MSEMLAALAEQNAALVKRIDANRDLMRWMSALLAVLILGLLWRWLG